MSHFYTAKRHERGGGWGGRSDVKLLCTKAYVNYESVNAITVPHKVECPECLKLLIPIAEKNLEQMRQSLVRQTGATPSSPTSGTTGPDFRLSK